MKKNGEKNGIEEKTQPNQPTNKQNTNHPHLPKKNPKQLKNYLKCECKFDIPAEFLDDVTGL